MLLCREREKASDFNATLHEHMQYVRRKHTAAGLRTQYEEQLAANLAMAAPDSLPQATDFSIPEGQNLVLKVPAVCGVAIVRMRNAGRGGRGSGGLY